MVHYENVAKLDAKQSRLEASGKIQNLKSRHTTIVYYFTLMAKPQASKACDVYNDFM
jgi:hypothetical protein